MILLSKTMTQIYGQQNNYTTNTEVLGDCRIGLYNNQGMAVGFTFYAVNVK